MRRREVKKLKKRVLSVALTIGMVAGMIPFANFGNDAYVEAAGNSALDYSYANTESGTVTRLRGVVDAFEDLPAQGMTEISNWDSWYAAWKYGERGTARRPFTILELVPYYDIATIGYQIEGCEPIDMQRVGGSNLVYGFGGADIFSYSNPGASGQKVYFFEDEREGKRNFYFNQSSIDSLTAGTDRFTEDQWDAKKVTDVITEDFGEGTTAVIMEGVTGYYERVAVGSGDFKFSITDDKLTVTKIDRTVDNTGNLVWHTVNAFQREEIKEKDKKNFKGYIKDLSTAKLSNYYKLDNIGDRVYTFRKNSDTDPVHDVSDVYFYYKSNDVFCETVLNLSKEEAANYSVLVKTITPEELNAQTKWLDVADLIYINSFPNNTEFLKMWRIQDQTGTPINRLKKAYCGVDLANVGDRAKYHSFYGTYPDDLSSAYANKKRDIKWKVAEKIIGRIASAKNYVGLVVDKGTVMNYILNAYGKDVQTGRYLLDGTRVGTDTFGSKACDNNIFKLWVMCSSINPNLVQKYYIDKGLITVGSDEYTASLSGRTGEEATYWSAASFYIGAELWPSRLMNELTTAETDELWEKYACNINMTAYNQYVNGHVYMHCEGGAMVTGFRTGDNCLSAGTDDHFSDFNDYIDTNLGTKEVYKKIHGKDDAYYDANVNGSSIASWAALRYILDIDQDVDLYYDRVRVLDIEPSVALGGGYSKPQWKLTTDMVRDMLPLYCTKDTEITVDHMLMTEFVGKIMDLNSQYDMVYLGEDAGGFWTGDDIRAMNSSQRTSYAVTARAGSDRTDFYDDSMDGLVYFHIGDLLFVSTNDRSGVWEQARNVNFGKQANNFMNSAGTRIDVLNSTVNRVQTRQPGNDLTNVKKSYLEEFVQGHYPIVVADHLFEDSYVQNLSECVIHNFLHDSDINPELVSESTTHMISDTKLEDKLRTVIRNRIDIEKKFDEYYYKTKTDVIKYLPRNPINNVAYLEFDIQVPQIDGYSYKIYFDKDRNAKFEEKEVQIDRPIAEADSIVGNKATVRANVPNGWVGFVQWKIVVYENANIGHRNAMEGCSANSEISSAKNEIKALQICPDTVTFTRDANGKISNFRGNFQGAGTNLAADSWQKLYKEVEDQGIFTISIDVVTWSEFNSIFKNVYEDATINPTHEKFTYHMGLPIGPLKNSEGEIITDSDGNTKYNPDETLLNAVEGSKCASKNLGDYNMIIVGFGDGYGVSDLNNFYGAGEYLYYFAENGCSILFTHDLDSFYTTHDLRTSRHNTENERTFGYTVESMMRDIMGMNRYGIYSKELEDDPTYFRADLFEDLRKYRNGDQGADANEKAEKKITYDWTSKPEQQGLTLWGALHKIGDGGSSNNTRSQYKYVVKNPDVNNNYYKASAGGTSSENNETTLAQKLNKGQITQYPYTISDNLKVTSTHVQYHELNLEEPGVTVWFTLEDTKQNGWDNGRAMSGPIIYGATPHNASNNYYIYSKGNIFYSGVGHRDVDQEEERKLFVNTMIAAYRPKSDVPYVEVTYPEVEISANSYTIRLDQELEYNSAGELIPDTSMSGILLVPFVPRDSNNAEEVLVWANYYGDSNGIVIYRKNADNSFTALTAETGDLVMGDLTYKLKVDKEYYIKYDKNLISSKPHVSFHTTSILNRSRRSSTELYIKARPMFRLG